MTVIQNPKTIEDFKEQLGYYKHIHPFAQLYPWEKVHANNGFIYKSNHLEGYRDIYKVVSPDFVKYVRTDMKALITFRSIRNTELVLQKNVVKSSDVVAFRDVHLINPEQRVIIPKFVEFILDDEQFSCYFGYRWLIDEVGYVSHVAIGIMNIEEHIDASELDGWCEFESFFRYFNEILRPEQELYIEKDGAGYSILWVKISLTAKVAEELKDVYLIENFYCDASVAVSQSFVENEPEDDVSSE